jgi:arylsulfatase A-like enzyme
VDRLTGLSFRWAVPAIFLIAGLLSCSHAPKQVPSAALPNIVWITVEDMSPRLAACGDSTAYTPNLDRFASEGVRYTNAYSVSGVCAPSRAALITGMYPTSIGAQHMRTLARTAAIDQVTDPESLAIPVYEAVPSPEVRCFTEYLRAAGYYCSNNSKTDYQFKSPVTAWDESSTQAHWRNRPGGMPFFSVFNFTTTHESQVWQRSGTPLLIDPNAVELPPYYPDTPIVRQDVARHYNNIQLMDAEVGLILRQLDQDGLADNTIVFFFGDHGDGLPRAKRWLYDSGLRVPFIVRYPDKRGAGSVNDELVSFVDFAPTTLSLAGVDIPSHIQGQAFLGPRKAAEREYIYAAKDRMDPAIDTARAVRDKQFKYIRNYRPEKPFVQFIPYRNQMGLMRELLRMDREGGLDEIQKLWFRKVKPVEELYDTKEDPHEVRNLAELREFGSVLEKMRSVHEKWVDQTGDLGMIPEQDLVKRMWPPDGVQPETEAPVLSSESDSFEENLEVKLECLTEGASIAYRIGDAEDWQLYSKPITIEQTSRITAQAVRIGFKPSKEVTVLLTRKAAGN